MIARALARRKNMTKIEAVIRDLVLVVEVTTNELQAPELALAFAYTGTDDTDIKPVKLARVVRDSDDAADMRLYRARVPLPSPEASAIHRLRGITFRITDGETTVVSDKIDATGWQVTCLHVPDRKVFNQVMRYIYQRIEDAETLMYVSLNTAQDKTVDLRIRITCFVVFCYRAIELGRHDVLEDRLGLFDEFEARFDELGQFTSGSVREVGEQVILSLLSVKWHTFIVLRRFDQTLLALRQILERGRDNPQYYQLPFATNYANAASLLTFVHFIADRPLGTPNPVQDMYVQFRSIMAGLPQDIPPYEYLFEFVPVMERMTILADMDWLLRNDTQALLKQEAVDSKALRRKKFACEKYTSEFMRKRCTRVTRAPEFDVAFVEFCTTALAQDA